jgi:hypothetical protein
VVDIKAAVAAAVETVAALAVDVAVDADADVVAHAARNAQLLQMPMATSFPKKWSLSTAVRKS